MNRFLVMNCSVFRSPRRESTYLYLPEGACFADLPLELRTAFGRPELVLELELTPDRRLATESPREVLDNLRTQGFHLQLPPGEEGGDFP